MDMKKLKELCYKYEGGRDWPGKWLADELKKLGFGVRMVERIPEECYETEKGKVAVAATIISFGDVSVQQEWEIPEEEYDDFAARENDYFGYVSLVNVAREMLKHLEEENYG